MDKNKVNISKNKPMLYEVEVKCGLTLPAIIGNRFYGRKTYDDGSMDFGN